MTLNSEVGLRNTKVQNGSIEVNIALWNNFTHYLAPLFCLFLKKIMFLLQNDILFTILQVPFVFLPGKNQNIFNIQFQEIRPWVFACFSDHWKIEQLLVQILFHIFDHC